LLDAIEGRNRLTATEIIAALRSLPRKELPSLLVAIAGLMAESETAATDDELIDVEAAAAMLGRDVGRLTVLALPPPQTPLRGESRFAQIVQSQRHPTLHPHQGGQ
jgi:hypothetical protein